MCQDDKWSNAILSSLFSLTISSFPLQPYDDMAVRDKARYESENAAYEVSVVSLWIWEPVSFLTCSLHSFYCRNLEPKLPSPQVALLSQPRPRMLKSLSSKFKISEYGPDFLPDPMLC